MSDNRFDLDPLVVAVRMAEDVKRERDNSQVVKLILDAAKQNYDAALDILIYADPTDVSEIMRAQNDAKRFLDIEAWITSVIVAGDNAEAQAHEEDRLS